MPSRRTRVLHLTTDGRLAGAERLLLGLADHLSRERFELLFMTVTPPGAFGEELTRRGRRALSLNCRSWRDGLGAVQQLRKFLKAEQIDILHTHLLHASLIGQLAVLPHRGVRTIHTRHYTDFFHRFGSPWARWGDQWATRRAEHVVAVSQGARDVLMQAEGIAPERVTVVHNGVDLEQVRDMDPEAVTAFRARWGLQGRLVIGTLGALHPRKGHRHFLHALARLRQQVPSVVGVLVGDGPLRPALEDEAKALGIADRVVLTGYCQTPSLALAAMDVVAHPSLEEGFGITILEALALSKPLVASRVGGIPEIVEDGRSGLLVEPANAEALAAALARLLADRSLATRLGAAGAERVEQAFTIQRMCRAYEALYDRMLDHPAVMIAPQHERTGPCAVSAV